MLLCLVRIHLNTSHMHDSAGFAVHLTSPWRRVAHTPSDDKCYKETQWQAGRHKQELEQETIPTTSVSCAAMQAWTPQHFTAALAQLTPGHEACEVLLRGMATGVSRFTGLSPCTMAQFPTRQRILAVQNLSGNENDKSIPRNT